MFGLSQIQLILIGGLLAVVLTAGGVAYVFHKGETAGAVSITTQVQSETIKAGEAARIQKEKADAEIRSTPYGERADGLR